MARARNIKPSLFKNELLGSEDPLLTILFCSLWCLADKSGRLEDRPLRIKAETFPYRDGIDINRYLTDLERLGFISRYSVGNLAIIQVTNFSKHQHPHHTEKESELPEFSDTCPLTVKPPLSDVELPVTLRLIPDSLNTDSLNLIPEENTTQSADGPTSENDLGPVCGQMILKSGEYYPVYESQITEWEKTYQALDVVYQLKAMKAWLEANPVKRKTKAGMPRFINAWLNRAMTNG